MNKDLTTDAARLVARVFPNSPEAAEIRAANGRPLLNVTPPPLDVIEQAFAELEPYRAKWSATGRVTFAGDNAIALWDDDREFVGVNWDAVRSLPDGVYLLSEWSDSSGYSPRWSGGNTQWIVVRTGQFRLLDCHHAGGRIETWGYKTPYEKSTPSEECDWKVLDNHPWATRERDDEPGETFR